RAAVSKFEQLTTGEQIAVVMRAAASLTEGIRIADSKFVKAVLSRHEGIALTDSLVEAMTALLKMSDGIAISDNVLSRAVMTIALNEGLSLSDAEWLWKALQILLQIQSLNRSLTVQSLQTSLEIVSLNRNLTTQSRNYALAVESLNRNLTVQTRTNLWQT